eukprot:3310749-Pyramimonas_sp.AAC.1
MHTLISALHAEARNQKYNTVLAGDFNAQVGHLEAAPPTHDDVDDQFNDGPMVDSRHIGND